MGQLRARDAIMYRECPDPLLPTFFISLRPAWTLERPQSLALWGREKQPPDLASLMVEEEAHILALCMQRLEWEGGTQGKAARAAQLAGSHCTGRRAWCHHAAGYSEQSSPAACALHFLVCTQPRALTHEASTSRLLL